MKSEFLSGGAETIGDLPNNKLIDELQKASGIHVLTVNQVCVHAICIFT